MVAIGAVCLLGSQVPATAQPAGRVSVLMQETTLCTVTPCRTAQLFTVSPDQGRLVGSEVFGNSTGASQVWVSPDGALQVWLTQTVQVQVPEYSLLIRNVVSGAILRVPVASAGPSMVGSPVSLEVYLADFQSVYALSPAGVRRFAPDQCSGLRPVAVSGDGSRLVVICPGTQFVGPAAIPIVVETLIFDIATGAIVRRFQGGGFAPVLSFAGRVLFTTVSPFQQPPYLMRADVDAGTTSTVIVGGLTTASRAFLNPRAAELFIVDFDAITVFAPDSLQVVRSAARRGTFLYAGVGFDQDRPWMYALDLAGVNIIQTTFSIIDTITLQTIGAGPLPSDSFPGSIVVASPPRPPVSLAATVAGAAVALTWSVGGAPASVTRYVLEAGSAPGLNDIIASLGLGLQTSFSASGVPPGRYYVRVRAGNYTGVSAPSNEVVVNVP